MWSYILHGVAQGSILGALIFNIYLCDLFMFLEESDIANYADDNSPFSCNSDTHTVLEKLDNDAKILLRWIRNNNLKANPDKFHLLLSDSDDRHSIKIDKYTIQNSKSEKLLGIIFDNDLMFNSHVSKLCTKASQKLHALSRVCNIMNFKQRRLIMKSFIHSQFGYCPIVWMFHSRGLNNRINNIHERTLRIVYKDYTTPFDELLRKDGSFTIHERNVQLFCIELFMIVNGLCPTIMSKILPLKNNVRYPRENIFITNNIRTVRYGGDSLTHMGPKIWSIIPENIRNQSSLSLFSKKIKAWKPNNCPCRLCKIYVHGVGYIN